MCVRTCVCVRACVCVCGIIPVHPASLSHKARPIDTFAELIDLKKVVCFNKCKYLEFCIKCWSHKI